MSVLGKKDTPLVDDFTVLDGSGNPVAGILPASFTVLLYDPTGAEVSGTVAVTITELGGGNYRASFTPTSVGDWLLIIIHSTYFPWGKRENYQVFEQLFDDITLDNLGVGNRVVEITVEDTFASPIVGAWVEVYDDTSTTRQAFGYTNSSGQIVFQLFDGDYKVYISKIGQFVFVVPEDLTVAADPPPPDVQVTYVGTAFDPGTPPSSDMCIIYGWEQDIQGTGLAVDVTAQIVGDDNFLTTNPHIDGDPVVVTSSPTHVNGNGYWSMALFRSGDYASGPRTVLYQFTIGDMVKVVEIPDEDIVAFSTLVDP